MEEAEDSGADVIVLRRRRSSPRPFRVLREALELFRPRLRYATNMVPMHKVMLNGLKINKKHLKIINKLMKILTNSEEKKWNYL